MFRLLFGVDVNRFGVCSVKLVAKLSCRVAKFTDVCMLASVKK